MRRTTSNSCSLGIEFWSLYRGLIPSFYWLICKVINRHVRDCTTLNPLHSRKSNKKNRKKIKLVGYVTSWNRISLVGKTFLSKRRLSGLVMKIAPGWWPRNRFEPPQGHLQSSHKFRVSGTEGISKIVAWMQGLWRTDNS